MPSPSETRVESSAIVMPGDSNHMGHAHGGWLMRLADEAGGLAAARHARLPVVTVAVENMVFLQPVPTGSVLRIEAQVACVGTSSISVDIVLKREDVFAGTFREVARGLYSFVALGEDRRPAPVPPLEPTTEAERIRAQELARLKETRGR